MSQSLVKNYVHIVFSTKHREDFIDEKIENELFSYITVLCKNMESNWILSNPDIKRPSGI